MRNTTSLMPRTVSRPGDAEMFTVIYDFAPTGYRAGHAGRTGKPTGTTVTGTWQAYRTRADGTLEIIRGRGILRQHIEDALAQAA